MWSLRLGESERGAPQKCPKYFLPVGVGLPLVTSLVEEPQLPLGNINRGGVIRKKSRCLFQIASPNVELSHRLGVWMMPCWGGREAAPRRGGFEVAPDLPKPNPPRSG